MEVFYDILFCIAILFILLLLLVATGLGYVWQGLSYFPMVIYHKNRGTVARTVR